MRHVHPTLQKPTDYEQKIKTAFFQQFMGHNRLNLILSCQLMLALTMTHEATETS